MARHTGSSAQKISKLMSVKELLVEAGGKSRTWFYDQIRKDPNFPKPVMTGPHSIAIVRAEFDAWIDSLPRYVPDGVSAVTRRAMQAKGGAV